MSVSSTESHNTRLALTRLHHTNYLTHHHRRGRLLNMNFSIGNREPLLRYHLSVKNNVEVLLKLNDRLVVPYGQLLCTSYLHV